MPLNLISKPPERIFAEPWEAQAFALATALQDAGLFTREEWARALGAEVSRDDQRPYYETWLAALEHIVVDKGATDHASLARMKAAWDHAARNTPHGKPIDPPPFYEGGGERMRGGGG